jgi:hypothetical protein
MKLKKSIFVELCLIIIERSSILDNEIKDVIFLKML